MNALPLVAAFLASPLLMNGCGGRPADGPPVVTLDDSVCDQCNMIISDERWATATVVHGPRGAEPRLFDDFNCQVNYEIEHPDAKVLTRWSHSHANRQWVRTDKAHFLMSPNLRTPMGSQAAAFASVQEADAAKAQLDGDVMTFEAAWSRLGFPGACCDSDHSDQSEPHKDHAHAP